MGHWRQVRIQNTMMRTPEEKRTRAWHVTQDTRQTSRHPENRKLNQEEMSSVNRIMRKSLFSITMPLLSLSGWLCNMLMDNIRLGKPSKKVWHLSKHGLKRPKIINNKKDFLCNSSFLLIVWNYLKPGECSQTKARRSNTKKDNLSPVQRRHRNDYSVTWMWNEYGQNLMVKFRMVETNHVKLSHDNLSSNKSKTPKK